MHIREQLIGLSADVVSPYLHQRLRGGFELPDWETAIFAPEQVAGAKFINRVGLPGCGCSTIIPFAGGELELSREGNNAIGTLYSFERSFQEGVALLGGLGMGRLSGIAFWFGRRSAEVAVTFEEYLKDDCHWSTVCCDRNVAKQIRKIALVVVSAAAAALASKATL